MADSRVAMPVDNARTYLLQSGMDSMLLQGHGVVASIHEVGPHSCIIQLDDDSMKTLHFDLSHMPSPERACKLRRWRKMLERSYSRCSKVRFIGTAVVTPDEWVAREHCFMMEQCQYLQNGDLALWEFYSGGFGGWSRATRWLKSKIPNLPLKVVGGGDLDETMTQMWNWNSQSFHAQPPGEPFPQSFNLDVRDEEAWDVALSQGANCFTMSSPCRSFSSAGNVKGWDATDARSLGVGLKLAQLHGAKALLLENVPNLMKNRTLWQNLQAIIRYCGFSIAFHGCYESNHMHPVDRTRLLMVICPTEEFHRTSWPTQVMDDVHTIPQQNLWDSKRWITVPEELYQDLILQPEVLELYAARKHMPAGMLEKVHTPSRGEHLFARRIKSTDSIPSGTLMAMYGKQHDLVANTDKKILGSLRGLSQDHYRFLHPVEAAVATGITGSLTMPRDFHTSAHALGNCITEYHSLVAIMLGLKVWNQQSLNINVPDFNVAEVLHHHRNDCITSQTIKLEWDQYVIIVSEQPDPITPTVHDPDSAASDDEFARIVQLHPSQLDPPVYRSIQVTPIVDDDIEPAFTVKCHQHVTPAEFKTAELQMHPCSPVHQFINFQDIDMNMDEPMPTHIDGIQIVKGCCDLPICLPGILLKGQDFAVFLDVPPTTRLSEIKLDQYEANQFRWHDRHGFELDRDGMVGFHNCLTTKSAIGWPMEKSLHYIQITTVHESTVHSHVVRHSDDETLLGLLKAEQIMYGPSRKVIGVKDRFGVTMPTHRNLKDVPVAVVETVDAHNKFCITLKKPSGIEDWWIQRGTRLFEIFNLKPNQMILDQTGTEIGLDLPIFGSMHLEVIEFQADDDATTSERSISPTIEFIAESPPRIPDKCRAPGINLSAMVQKNTDEIEAALNRLTRNPAEFPLARKVVPRLETLCEYGPAVGNDEMSFMMYQSQHAAPHVQWIMLEWSELHGEWRLAREWDQVKIDPTTETLAAIFHDGHWIAMHVIFPDDDVEIRYWMPFVLTTTRSVP